MNGRKWGKTHCLSLSSSPLQTHYRLKDGHPNWMQFWTLPQKRAGQPQHSANKYFIPESSVLQVDGRADGRTDGPKNSFLWVWCYRNTIHLNIEANIWLGGNMAPLYNAVLCTSLHCTALHCTALHCTALYCTFNAHLLSQSIRGVPWL
jgi:hypothetical protein